MLALRVRGNAMICLSCRNDDHGLCPERRRQAIIDSRSRYRAIWDWLTPALDELAMTTGQVCDCGHVPQSPGQLRQTAL